MTTKRDAEVKVHTASVACDHVHKSMHAAYNTLNKGMNTNGYGIYHDRFSVRDQILEAQTKLQTALQVLDGIDWPTDNDYDQL